MKDYTIFSVLSIACFLVSSLAGKDKELRWLIIIIGIVLLISGVISAYFEI